VFAIGSTLTYLRFFWECATPPHVHPTSRYTIARDQFYQAFPYVSIASDKHWGEKAWVQGYEQLVFAIVMTLRNSVVEVATHSYNMYVLRHWLCVPEVTFT